MKLLIIHSKKNYNKMLKKTAIDKNTILLVSDKNVHSYVNKDHWNKIHFVDFNDSETVYKVEKETLHIVEELNKFSNVDDNDQDSTFHINRIYKQQQIVFNTLSKIESLDRKFNFNEIHLIAGNPKSIFLAFNLAEGEIPFKFLYKREWFINYFIINRFNKNKKIVQYSKTSKFYLETIKKLKLNLILFGKLCVVLWKKSRANKTKDLKPVINSKIIFTIRSIGQINSFKHIFTKLVKEGFEYSGIVIENFSNSGTLNILAKNNVNKFINIYSFISYIEILNTYFESFKKLNINLKYRKMNEEKIILEYKKELISYEFDLDLISLSLNKIRVLNKSGILINNETHGHIPGLISDWAKKNNLYSIGVQHVAISNSYLPVVSWMDQMYLTSFNLYNELRKMKKNEKFSYIGPISFENYFDKNMNREKLEVITFYTQPDYFLDYNPKYIEDILKILIEEEIKCIFIVKIHPRDKNKKKYTALIKKYKNKGMEIEMIDRMVDSNQVISKSDLTLSMTSGVLMQSILIGTPTISLNYPASKYDYDYLNHDVMKTIYNYDQLRKSIKDYRLLVQEFKKNREDYLKENLNNYNGKGLSSFIKDIKDKVR